MAWGGPDEQAKEITAGNRNAKNWHYKALKVVEAAMEEYWTEAAASQARSKGARTVAPASSAEPTGTLELDYDRHRRMLIEQARCGSNMGWAAELRCYLNDLPENVVKDMDIVLWWLEHSSIYPTLARIVQDVCVIPASSVPCKCLFSAGAEIATDRRAHLGAERFEELQVMKHAWCHSIVDCAAANSHDVEVFLQEYQELYQFDEEMAQLDRDEVEVVTT
ncbi:hypothetical protein PAXRUDRAFT_168520 [Paxillus rubicundulus Ve08.2h10]|uniref:HAT C-terminal dimerisation domain-containing protein n=1 Tax=Paxillus rubicundulus Ve08.2h10 TaxID=930991 RepID=A0A0D0CNQ9_9AGAM|nr:hypothetical protein PAXRUDRAFT_168520 [Paxillus rubicundulus Ve08.2h10]